MAFDFDARGEFARRRETWDLAGREFVEVGNVMAMPRRRALEE